jgi:hypothetical protein
MRRRWSRRWPTLTLAGALVLLGVVCLAAFETPPPPQPPRAQLAVLVVFDQLRGDYLERWQELFEEGGFRRLQEEGAWFQNCHYPYAHTVTAAGHASLLTGCSPQQHGIVGNNWYDIDAGRSVYCVAEHHEQVPATLDEGARGRPSRRPGHGGSPGRLLAPTVGDVLKEITAGRARVVSLSIKDRSAVLPGGHRPDVCCWLCTSTGRFVTSTYYRTTLPAWVEAFNRGRPADRWFGQDWNRLRPDLDYLRHSGPDDVPGEGRGILQGRTFPHPTTGGLKTPGSSYYQALYNSPFGNELLLQLAKRAIDAEQLGQRGVPDLLCVSFSCNDPIGHCWGPDSQEVLDVTLRSDLIVRELLAYLDSRVGRGNYLLALSADHGVCPLPEVARSRGKQAGRIGSELLDSSAEAFLNDTYGSTGSASRFVEYAIYPWVYLNRRVLRERKLDQAEVERTLAGWLKQQPGVLTAYTRTELERGVPADDHVGQRVRRSFHPQRCGDVTVVFQPYHIPSSGFATGTTHGTPHPYDTHVPLLVYGPGIAGGPRREPVTPQAVAAIFARGLNIPPPALAEAPVPRTLRRP